ncbi:MAG: SDR family NAD(P)-dependent oxidoreductase, partial [Actinobacteria bacterium]|nr:SDR family NAD(P)-dependent oxidoreductase [Actinomycetota bacterium]
MFALTGKSAIVTGAGRGIGKGITASLLKQEARVLLVDRDEASVVATTEEFRAAGGDVGCFVGDTTSLADMANMAAKAVDLFGGIDIVVANAGVQPLDLLPDVTDEKLQDVMGNFYSMVYTVNACLEEIKRSDNGRIVIVSSITGPITGFAGFSHYGASKAAEIGWMKTVAMEIADTGTTFNALLPGNTATGPIADYGPEYHADVKRTNPIGRLGTVDEMGA